MLSRLLFVRLKAAENALRDGRIDEAYRLATQPDMREHRRGAAVLSALTEKFIERARNHFRADRFAEALLDLHRAETGAVLKEQIAELRENIRVVATEKHRDEQSRRNRLGEAKRRIEGGSLAAGRDILEQASASDHGAQALKQAAETRVDEAARILEQVERLLEQGQTAAAVQRLRRAKAIDTHAEDCARLESRLIEQVLTNARSALRDGKPGRASDELACLSDLGKSTPARRELNDILAASREAARCLQKDDYAEARRHAMSLHRLLPEAPWVQELIDQLRQIDDIRTALRAGPLGDRVEAAGTVTIREPARVKAPDETIALPGRIRAEGALPDRLLLLVDGGGSYLIARGHRVTIGRAASDRPADVAVFSDIAEQHASIARVDDDYFLFSDKEAEVGGQRTQHQLLRDGDRITLGRKAKFGFHLPSRKSATAVLDLSDTTKMPNDVRRVVLFHEQATLGNGPTAHILCRNAGPSLILFERNGTMWLRQRNDGHVDATAVELRLGEPVELAGANVVLKPWELRTPGGKTT
jgi:tetratricopeptide (TPR) repeat protein